MAVGGSCLAGCEGRRCDSALRRRRRLRVRKRSELELFLVGICGEGLTREVRVLELVL